MEQNVTELKTGKVPPPAAGSDQLVDIRETCATLSIGPTKCWELINQGKLEVVRLGSRCTRVRKSSIDRLIQNGAS